MIDQNIENEIIREEHHAHSSIVNYLQEAVSASVHDKELGP